MIDKNKLRLGSTYIGLYDNHIYSYAYWTGTSFRSLGHVSGHHTDEKGNLLGYVDDQSYEEYNPIFDCGYVVDALIEAKKHGS